MEPQKEKGFVSWYRDILDVDIKWRVVNTCENKLYSKQGLSPTQRDGHLFGEKALVGQFPQMF